MRVHQEKAEPIQHFILVFDRHAGRKVEELHFGTDREKAIVKYEELEAQYRDAAEMDIVLIGSDSIETVQVTHSTYFGTPGMDFDQSFADLLGMRSSA